MSLYYDAPVVYRYHDVYTYHDVESSEPAGYDVYGYEPSDAERSYHDPSQQAYENGAGLDTGPGATPDDVPIEWTYDPPDGVGPPLDWAGQRTPLPGEPALLDDGLRAFRSNDFETARSAFIRAILIDERDAYAKFLYGLASFAQGDYAVASLSWRRVALADGLFVNRPPDVRVLYGDVNLFDSQMDELSRVAMNRLDDRGVRFTLAYLFYATGEPRIASELFARLAEADPADLLARQLADASAEAALERDPADVAAGRH